MKKWTYFIPIYGFIKMMIKPHETDDALFALGFIFWHLLTTVPLPLGCFMWLKFYWLSLLYIRKFL